MQLIFIVKSTGNVGRHLIPGVNCLLSWKLDVKNICSFNTTNVFMQVLIKLFVAGIQLCVRWRVSVARAGERGYQGHKGHWQPSYCRV